jgi:hypothetical protein
MWLKRARHRGTLGRGLTIFSGSRWWEAPGWFWSPAFHQKIPWRSQTCLKATSKRLRKSGWPWATLQGSRVMYIYICILVIIIIVYYTMRTISVYVLEEIDPNMWNLDFAAWKQRSSRHTINGGQMHASKTGLKGLNQDGSRLRNIKIR